VDTLAPSGQVVGHEWADYVEDEPAEVLTGPGREFNAADMTQAETDARIFIRWRPDVDTTMRVLWEGRRFNILSIETDVTARRELRLRCKEGLTDGA
jgi:SPP1 family predicted phage head-tail adaptor